MGPLELTYKRRDGATRPEPLLATSLCRWLVCVLLALAVIHTPCLYAASAPDPDEPGAFLVAAGSQRGAAQKEYIIVLKEGFVPNLALYSAMPITFAVYEPGGMTPAPDGVKVELLAQTQGGSGTARKEVMSEGLVKEGTVTLEFIGDLQRRVCLYARAGASESGPTGSVTVGGIAALDAGFIIGPGGSNGWSFIGVSLDWDDAVEFCASHGGRLPGLEYYPLSEGFPEGFYWTGQEIDRDTVHTLMGSLHGLGVHSGASPKDASLPVACTR